MDNVDLVKALFAVRCTGELVTTTSLVQKRKTLTLQEWTEYMRTDEYLILKWYEKKYSRNCKEWQRLKSRRDEIAIEAFHEALELAEKQTPDDVLKTAERMLVDAEMIPPTYSQFCNCKGCGPVLVPVGYDKETDNCPWCDSWLRAEVLKEQAK